MDSVTFEVVHPVNIILITVMCVSSYVSILHDDVIGLLGYHWRELPSHWMYISVQVLYHSCGWVGVRVNS